MWETIALITVAISEVPCCSMNDITEICVSWRTQEAQMATSSLWHNEDAKLRAHKGEATPLEQINHQSQSHSQEMVNAESEGILNPPCQGLWGKRLLKNELWALWVIYVYVWVYRGSRNNRVNPHSACELGEQDEILLITWCVCNWVYGRNVCFLWR